MPLPTLVGIGGQRQQRRLKLVRLVAFTATGLVHGSAKGGGGSTVATKATLYGRGLVVGSTRLHWHCQPGFSSNGQHGWRGGSLGGNVTSRAATSHAIKLGKGSSLHGRSRGALALAFGGGLGRLGGGLGDGLGGGLGGGGGDFGSGHLEPLWDFASAAVPVRLPYYIAAIVNHSNS